MANRTQAQANIDDVYDRLVSHMYRADKLRGERTRITELRDLALRVGAADVYPSHHIATGISTIESFARSRRNWAWLVNTTMLTRLRSFPAERLTLPVILRSSRWIPAFGFSRAMGTTTARSAWETTRVFRSACQDRGRMLGSSHRRIPCGEIFDLNGDGDVDLEDLAALTLIFGDTPGANEPRTAARSAPRRTAPREARSRGHEQHGRRTN